MSDLTDPMARLKTYAKQMRLAWRVSTTPAKEHLYDDREVLDVRFSDWRRVTLKNYLEDEEGIVAEVNVPRIYNPEDFKDADRREDLSPPDAADLLDEVREKVDFYVDLSPEESEIAADMMEDGEPIRWVEQTLMTNRIHGDEPLPHEEYLFAAMVKAFRKAERAMVEEEPVYSGHARSLRAQLMAHDYFSQEQKPHGNT
jgi:hypothetical protein